MLCRISLAISVLCCAAAAENADAIAGQWAIGPLVDAASVQLTLYRSREGSEMSSSSSLDITQLRGLSAAQMNSAGATVHFGIVRDAGTLACDGYFNSGIGGGTFAFSPNPHFLAEMASLGFPGLTAEMSFRMAVHDVTISWVADLRTLGYARISADQLLTMRIHNVSGDYIRALKKLGYTDLSPDQLVTMRIHGVALDFIEQLKDLGYQPSADQLVTMCIHGVKLDYVRLLRSLGYEPTIDQLVTLRIHGVTPEYIQKLQARGIRNLSIDQIVTLKIHGIVD